MVCAPRVKSYMAVGAYPAEEEPYSQGTDLLFIVCAPVVNLKVSMPAEVFQKDSIASLFLSVRSMRLSGNTSL